VRLRRRTGFRPAAYAGVNRLRDFIVRKRRIKDGDLSGNNPDDPKWVEGLNGVYRNDYGPKPYRVSIRTSNGWVSYGHFNHKATAAYVANVAILATGTYQDYQLNTGVRSDKNELQRWLNEKHENRQMHDQAKILFEEDSKREFPLFSGLNKAEQYIKNIESGQYAREELLAIKSQARVGGSISQAIERALAKIP
jgi:hypothetical protein